MSEYGDLLKGLRGECKAAVAVACPQITEQMTAVVANRTDWRTLVNEFEQSGGTSGLGTPWAVLRFGAAILMPDPKPAGLVTQAMPLDIYYITGFRDASDGSKKSDTDVQDELDDAAGAIVAKFMAGGFDNFTVSPEVVTTGGDVLDANTAFFQYKLELEAVKVSLKLWITFAP